MKNKGMIRINLFYVILGLMLIWTVFSLGTGGISGEAEKQTTVSELITQLKNNNVQSIKMQKGSGVVNITGEFKEAIDNKTKDTGVLTVFLGSNETKVKKFKTYAYDSLSMLNRIETPAYENGVTVEVTEESSAGFWFSLAASILPIAVLLFFMMNMMGNMGGGNRNPMSFGKIKQDSSKVTPSKVRFSDVAGADEEKQELVEIVEFLQNPRKFTALGARIPSGVLLEGPPGTGKTLLAKAVAGEANVPFHSISGSEFVEMFAGVGASRVRDLFEKAKKSAPAIIFIDEIDAVGRKRGSGALGGNDEREQTLNQLLVEMDGFEESDAAVIVMAATNRSDVLDPALLRPGRFDRQILVGLPDVKAREAILKVHARKKPLAPEVKLHSVAQKTPGFSGADLENLLNESALIAARRDKKKIDLLDIDEAQDRLIGGGPAKVNHVRSEKSNRIVAYHETGHAIVGLVLDGAEDVHKVTIVPRGHAAGYVIVLPKEDQVVISKDELFQRVVGILAGRAAEEIVFNDATTGASDDFRKATAYVRSMVMRYGMSEKLGMVQYETDNQEYGAQKPYSDATAYEIDQEVRDITERAYQKAKEVLLAHRDKLDLIANKLIEVETLDGDAFKSLFETGVLPTYDSQEYPSETASFEEVKEQLEKKDKRREEKEDI